MESIESFLIQASAWILPALFAITLHEAAHGWAAWKLGDDTALRLGRVSFNPLRHIDPVGTVLVPGALLLFKAPFLFGWAKPVPVDFWRLPNPRRDMALVAIAGPGVNLAQAYVAALLFHLIPYFGITVGGWLAMNLENAIFINLILFVFNMMPLPPLDGGRVAVGLLPLPLARLLARVEPYGMVILLIFLLALPLAARTLGYEFNPLAEMLWPLIGSLQDILLVLAGHSG
ncbi:site-2 protease family protein [Ferrovibrio sp.]|uniref:site-2 protease family protein n=1 Tax=Ferrovibrio sp. TaxID=1917215 RepID=UPI003D0A6101